MSRRIHLLGRPQVDGPVDVYQFRSRKSWALLAFLLLNERAPSRGQLATLLFCDAADPLGALRWSLAEVRRALGPECVLEGDPVVLRLGSETVVDVDVVLRGSWPDAVRLPRLGSELLEGLTVRDAAAFESWLLAEQRRVAAASEAMLHEAALGSMSRGDVDDAIGYAVRALAMSPLNENHHALLIRLYRIAGDQAAAVKQLATCTELLSRELGLTPGVAVHAAFRETHTPLDGQADATSIQAAIEAGAAAVSAGATETGADSLRAAVRLADRAGLDDLRVAARLVLAETLIHSLRGMDEEGMATLLAADDIAVVAGDRGAVAQARAELGYVDFLRARYDRAEVWLSEALTHADSPGTAAKATTYLGTVHSDRAAYGPALLLLERGAAMARSAGDLRRAAYAVSMLGRVHLLRHDLDLAAEHLDESVALAEQDHWLAFLPWPQALRGEVELARGDPAGAAALLEQSFARACRLGDPCWEGMAGRGLALVAETAGDTDGAFGLLADARRRANRLTDPYVWLDGYILDAQCALGRLHGHPETASWIASLRELSSRTGMRELTLRSMLHGAALGNATDAATAALLAGDVDNPRLDLLPAP